MVRTSVPETGMELLSLAFQSNWNIVLSISPWLIAIIFIVLAVFLLIRLSMGYGLIGKDFELDSGEMGLGDSKLTFKPNVSDKTVAYRVWVELSTRKIGLEIDLDHDVIDEIYDSWYAFFAVTRDLIKDIPVNKVRNRSTKNIINLSIDVLNVGLRPHLTRWQARFRRWYKYRLDKDVEAELHPQQLQKEFPEYEELVEDLMRVNSRLVAYRRKMDDLVHS